MVLETTEPVRTHCVPKFLLTVSEAAEACGMSKDTFYRRVIWQLATVKEGRLRLVPISELQAWVERRKTGGA
jgi:excisionase family DNA binding protein